MLLNCLPLPVKEGRISVRVHPTFLPSSHPLANVHDVYNAVFVRGDAVGEAMFYGRGAGEMPTANADSRRCDRCSLETYRGASGRILCTLL